MLPVGNDGANGEHLYGRALNRPFRAEQPLDGDDQHYNGAYFNQPGKDPNE